MATSSCIFCSSYQLDVRGIDKCACERAVTLVSLKLKERICAAGSLFRDSVTPVSQKSRLSSNSCKLRGIVVMSRHRCVSPAVITWIWNRGSEVDVLLLGGRLVAVVVFAGKESAVVLHVSCRFENMRESTEYLNATAKTAPLIEMRQRAVREMGQPHMFKCIATPE